jgi:hypothetical protein
MKKIYLVLLWVTVSEVAFSQSKVLSVIGSSTAAGTGASVPDSNWVNRLVKYYQQLGLTVELHNLAVGGRNCYHGMPSSYTPPPLRDFPQTLENITKALSFSPNVVLVNYPTNNYHFYSIAEIMDCLQAMKDSANALGKICYITTSQPRQDGSFPDLPTRTLLKVIRDSIMNRFGNYAIDFWTGIALPDYTINPVYSFGDNIHLNDAGHRELFKRVRNKDVFGIGLVNRAIIDGNWENPATWENGEIPTIADSVVILGGRTVTLNSNVQVRALSVIPTATFTITSSRMLKIGN